ncbi:hypothetical protein LZK73_18575 [Neorhizobium galegae]|nr:hypothetical protein LZK73_18575 [Neorhizobium galegae]
MKTILLSQVSNQMLRDLWTTEQITLAQYEREIERRVAESVELDLHHVVARLNLRVAA